MPTIYSHVVARHKGIAPNICGRHPRRPAGALSYPSSTSNAGSLGLRA